MVPAQLRPHSCLYNQLLSHCLTVPWPPPHTHTPHPQIIFLEDPLAEDDWAGFGKITSEIGKEYEVRARFGIAHGMCVCVCLRVCLLLSATIPAPPIHHPSPTPAKPTQNHWQPPFLRPLVPTPAKPPSPLTAPQIIGDDLLCTNPNRIVRAIEAKACNGLLLKVNQIGSVTESIRAVQLAKSAGWGVLTSHRCAPAAAALRTRVLQSMF